MPDVVVDTSFLLPLFLKDEDDTHVGTLFDEVDQGTNPHAPDFYLVELGNVLLTSVRRQRITGDDLIDYLAEIAGLPIEVHPTTSTALLPAQLALASRNALSLYDAVYLNLAIRLSARLATSDGQLHGAAVREGVTVFP